MSTKKKKHPGTKGPHGKHAPYRGDDIPVQVPTVRGNEWVVKNGFAQGIKGA